MKIYIVLPYYSDCEGTEIYFSWIKPFTTIKEAKKYASDLGSCEYEIEERELDIK